MIEFDVGGIISPILCLFLLESKALRGFQVQMVRTTLGSLDITSVPGSQLRTRICPWRRSTMVKALGLRQRQRQELRITAHSLNPGISDLDVEGLERSTSPYSSFHRAGK